MDGTGRILWASDQAARLLGYPEVVPSGLPTEELFGGTLTTTLKDPSRHQRSQPTWGTARRPNGDCFPSSLTWVGQIGLDRLWLLRDLSDQQALERLRAFEERYNASQKFAQIGVWDWLLGTDELFWSEEIYAMFGINPEREKPSYRLFRKMVHPEDAERVTSAEQACIHDGERHDPGLCPDPQRVTDPFIPLVKRRMGVRGFRLRSFRFFKETGYKRKIEDWGHQPPNGLGQSPARIAALQMIGYTARVAASRGQASPRLAAMRFNRRSEP
ncbi:PAS domain-containing protein [Rhodospirillum sp. A1_3_36]|uniref:PAS domain-containing protein n=1 Tax=Rhodospirillum sp. A1_3_36 TaxID=3391666 RepID=UPI0039A5D37F